jgi:hypothetical protein
MHARNQPHIWHVPAGDDELLADLEARQPGSDGGKLRPRFEKRSFSKDVEPDDLQRALADIVEILLIKAAAGKMSEHTVAEELASRAAAYRRSGLDSLADALPESYKAMLSMLQDTGKLTFRSTSGGATMQMLVLVL